MTFDEFLKQVDAAGLRARECSAVHWQILDGDQAVNIWPFTEKGFRMQAEGELSRPGTVAEAVALAGSPRTEKRQFEPSLTPAMLREMACPWVREELGVIRRFWRWLW